MAGSDGPKLLRTYYHGKYSNTRLLLHVIDVLRSRRPKSDFWADSSHKSYEYQPKSLHPSPDFAGAQDQCLTHVMTPRPAHSQVQSLLRRPIQMHGTSTKRAKRVLTSSSAARRESPRTEQPSLRLISPHRRSRAHTTPHLCICRAVQHGQVDRRSPSSRRHHVVRELHHSQAGPAASATREPLSDRLQPARSPRP